MCALLYITCKLSLLAKIDKSITIIIIIIII